MRSPLFLLFPLVLYVLIDLYVYPSFKALDLGRWSRRAWWIVHGLVYAYLLWGFFSYTATNDTNGMKKGVHGFMILTVLLYVPKFIPLFFGLLEDLVRYPASLATGTVAERRKFLHTVAWSLAAVPFAGILHGVLRGRWAYRTVVQKMYLRGLDAAFEGYRIAQISDIHSGSFTDPDEVQAGIDELLAARADAVVFTGDLVNNTADEMEPWMDAFRAIAEKTPDGVYSILGNHDYGDYWQWPSEEAKRANLDRLKSTHAALGWRLLLNEALVLRRGTGQLDLVGVENWGLPPFPQYGNLERALEGLDPQQPKILLSHDPSHFDAVVKKHPANIGLTLSGHTHGMQFGIEIPGWIQWSPVKWKYPKWAGLYRDNASGKALYVNRGFGYLAFPGRVGIWPEITVLELTAKPLS